MSENTTLIPVFIPPLARLLVDGEAAKGSPLTELEVVNIRDAAYCVMMPASEADEMTKNRGFHDVEPENCWADWHRLRVSMTGKGRRPQIILCVPGDADLISIMRPTLEAAGIEHHWLGHDDRVLSAFEATARGFDPSFEEEDFASISRHAGILFVLRNGLGITSRF
jgi:hypothetical protein